MPKEVSLRGVCVQTDSLVAQHTGCNALTELAWAGHLQASTAVTENSAAGMELIRELVEVQQESALTFCLAPSRAALVWSMAFTAYALALSVKLALPPSCMEAATLECVIVLVIRPEDLSGDLLSCQPTRMVSQPPGLPQSHICLLRYITYASACTRAPCRKPAAPSEAPVDTELQGLFGQNMLTCVDGWYVCP